MPVKKSLVGIFISFTAPLFALALDGYTVREASLIAANNFLNTDAECGERIWRDYQTPKINILFVDDGNSDSYLTALLSEKRLSEIPRATTGLENVGRSTYSYFQIDGQSWLSINTLKLSTKTNLNTLVKLADETYRLAVHEGFHYMQQRNWSAREGLRGTLLPIRHEPRVYRTMLMRNLFTAYKNSATRTADLQQARYWYDLWFNNYPNEVLSTTDNYEGTAQYVEQRAQALVHAGCNATEETLRDQSLALLDPYLDPTLNIYSGDNLDTEGYTIGGLAALILAHMEDTGWQEQAEQDITPLEALMSKFSPQAQATAPGLEEQALAFTTDSQAEAEQTLASTYQTLKNENKIFISIPREWKAGSTNYRDFFVDTNLNLSFDVLGQNVRFADAAQSSWLEITDGSVLLGTSLNPCTSRSFSAVLTADYILSGSDKKLEIHTENLIASINGTIRQDSAGQRWFCAGE